MSDDERCRKVRSLIAAALAAAASSPILRPVCAAGAPGPVLAPAAVFENRRAMLVIDARGQAVSLRAKAARRELLAKPWPLVSARLKDGRLTTACSASRRGDALTFDFPGGLGSAVIEVDARRDFFTFTVRSLTLANADALTFCELPVTPVKYRGNMANMLSDDVDAVCLRGYDLPVEMGLAGDSLRVWTTAGHGLVGWRAGLAAGPKADMPVMLRSMAEQAGVPYSALGGPWSRGAEANRGSYLFADLTHASTDDWIEIARRGGLSTLHLHGWWSSLGHYGVNTNFFPRGLADMRDSVRRIRGAGLRAGVHTLTAGISLGDAWVTPEASPHLLPFDTYTLARALSPTDTVLYVNEIPSPRHDVVFTYKSNGNAIRIGGEIVRYERVLREPPYGFARCTRGAFKTRPAAHAAGERADYLQQRYFTFFPQPDSPLADALAERLADVFNACKLDQIYFDGAEGMLSRYGIDTMRHKIFKRLDGNPLVEASCLGGHNWWFHSRLGAWDHPGWAVKDFHDRHIAHAARFRDSDLLEPQLGWWEPHVPTPHQRGHFLDEMEYFACKNLGLDAASSLQGLNVSAAPLTFHIENQLTLYGWYENLRLARYFDAQTTARVAVPGDEFRLGQNRDGAWQFTPVKMMAHRVSALGNGSEAWAVRNPYGEQPAGVRVEALYAAAPYDSPARRPLVGAGDFAALKIATASPSISLGLEEETADTRGGGRNLRLRAENKGASRVGSWARASLTFAAPYRNVGGAGAFGLWIKGDGKGALLNLQLATPREFDLTLSDHCVVLDFTGWRYVELLVRERDVELYSRPRHVLGAAGSDGRSDGQEGKKDYVWPYGGLAEMYIKTLDLAHLSQVSLYLNDLPPGEGVEVTVSPVMALPARSAALASPELTLNGQTFTLPFTLSSGDFAEVGPDGRCTHYSGAGDPLARARIQVAGPASATSPRMPALRAGLNAVRFSCRMPTEASARAQVTFSALGTPFGSPNPRREIGWQHLEREYEMTRLFLASNDVDCAEWEVPVRPGAKAKLEIELCGAMAEPVLTVGGRTLRFPVTLEDGQRLLCRDRRRWTVIDARHAMIAEGRLEERAPALASGPNRVSFACSAHGRAHVKLVKVYE